MASSIGLDVGGAHLKIAAVNNGRVNAVDQIVCPLWQGLNKLHDAVDLAKPSIENSDVIGVTMTGELSDLFPDRASGVTTLVDTLSDLLGRDLLFWQGPTGFGGADTAKTNPENTGSTNFLASATFAAQQVSDGILIDFGSTTTDIVAFQNGVPIPKGTTDAERHVSGELVYTGMTRTPVMGVTTRVPFHGQWQTLAREVLATMGDVRRILGELPKGLDLHQTADGRSQSVEDSVARFARMFGRDKHDGSSDDWRHAAAFVREAQVRSIQDDLMRVISGLDSAAFGSHNHCRYWIRYCTCSCAPGWPFCKRLRHPCPRRQKSTALCNTLCACRCGRPFSSSTHGHPVGLTPSARRIYSFVFCSARQPSTRSINQPHASNSSGPAVFETAISRYLSSASTFSTGSILRRETSTAHSMTAACALFKPANGACAFTCTSFQRNFGRTSSSSTSTTSSSQ